MTSSGKVETEKLKENLRNQLDRLVQQLNDLEDCRDELDSSEYEETKQATIEQLKEFQESLPRIIKGDVSLISSIAALQMETQTAISKAFKTPEVIKLFGKQEPKQLRDRLHVIEQDLKLGKCSNEFANNKKAEILSVLRQLGEKLSSDELKFLEKQTVKAESATNFEFEKINEDDDS